MPYSLKRYLFSQLILEPFISDTVEVLSEVIQGDLDPYQDQEVVAMDLQVDIGVINKISPQVPSP